MDAGAAADMTGQRKLGAGAGRAEGLSQRLAVSPQGYRMAQGVLDLAGLEHPEHAAHVRRLLATQQRRDVRRHGDACKPISPALWTAGLAPGSDRPRRGGRFWAAGRTAAGPRVRGGTGEHEPAKRRQYEAGPKQVAEQGAMPVRRRWLRLARLRSKKPPGGQHDSRDDRNRRDGGENANPTARARTVDTARRLGRHFAHQRVQESCLFRAGMNAGGAEDVAHIARRRWQLDRLDRQRGAAIEGIEQCNARHIDTACRIERDRIAQLESHHRAGLHQPQIGMFEPCHFVRRKLGGTKRGADALQGPAIEPAAVLLARAGVAKDVALGEAVGASAGVPHRQHAAAARGCVKPA